MYKLEMIARSVSPQPWAGSSVPGATSLSIVKVDDGPEEPEEPLAPA
jgi:hypothetical protein